MGYFSLDFRKAKGASDSRMSDHIERRVIAPNVDPMRTHLNRELVRMPEGIRERDDAIAARISSAGIRRKITHDQVRAIRVMLSGTHEDMMEIEKAGKLDDWCRDSMDWLYRTFGRENVVSAVLHMDEHTPHIHATLVPIVTGERRKAGQKKPKEGGRTYRKKANTARLCADDVLNRTRLLAYHDDYAKVMVKYDLQRGVRGSEARHVSTAQYYRDLRRQTGELEANVRQLQAEQEEAEKRLETARKEINTQKLEAVKVEAKTAIIAKVGSLLGSGKIRELEADNRSLQNEIAAREESIEDLPRCRPTTSKNWKGKGSGRHICKNGRIVRADGSRFSPTRCAWRGTAVRQASRPSRRTGFSPSSRWNTAETSTPKSTRKASP